MKEKEPELVQGRSFWDGLDHLVDCRSKHDAIVHRLETRDELTPETVTSKARRQRLARAKKTVDKELVPFNTAKKLPTVPERSTMTMVIDAGPSTLRW
jgi:hypothetical protein